MENLDIIKKRHSVRNYNGKKIENETADILTKLIDECNKEGNLNIQLCLEEPRAFDSMLAHYGKFSNVKNYIGLIGKKSQDLEERIGYYGEKIVLKATEMGLGTCWVAMTYSKRKSAFKIGKGEKVICVISLGYFDKEVGPHKTKSIEELSEVKGEMPDWFKRGVEAVQLAPTAMNQQKFKFIYDGERAEAIPGKGFYTKVDLGIAKLHFEIGAGTEANINW